MTNGVVKIVTKLETKEFDAGKTRLEKGLWKLVFSVENLKRATFAVGSMARKVFVFYGATVRSAGVAIAGIGKQMAKTGSAVKGLLKSMLRFISVSQIMKTISEGLRNMAQVSGPANEMISNISTSFLYLKNSIASAVMPILQVLSPIISVITGSLASLFNMIGMITARIFGGATTFTKAKKAQVDYAASLNKTGKEAKTTAGALAAFDELDVLPGTGEAGGSDASGMPSAAQMFEEVQIPDDTLAFADKIGGLFEKLKAGAQPAIDAFKNLWEALAPVKDFAWTALQDFYEGFLKPVGEWIFGEDSGLPRFIDILREGLEKINWETINEALRTLWEALTPFAINVGEGLLWLWENILVPLETWTMNEVVPGFLGMLAEALSFVNSVIETIKPGVLWLWDNLLSPIATWTGGVFLDTISLITETFGTLTEWFGANAETINGLLTGIGEILAVLWENGFKPILEDLWVLFKAVFEDLLNAVLGITEGIMLALSGVVEFIQGVFTADWGKAWEGVKKIFGGVWNAIASIVEGAINLITEAINWCLRQLNRIWVDVPEWVTDITGMTGFGFNIPLLQKSSVVGSSLPRLATGAVIPPNAEFMAILGDQKHGRNLEAPEGLIEEIVNRAVFNALGNTGGESMTVDMPVYLDGREIYRNHKKIEWQRGKSLISGVRP